MRQQRGVAAVLPFRSVQYECLDGPEWRANQRGDTLFEAVGMFFCAEKRVRSPRHSHKLAVGQDFWKACTRRMHTSCSVQLMGSWSAHLTSAAFYTSAPVGRQDDCEERRGGVAPIAQVIN